MNDVSYISIFSNIELKATKCCFAKATNLYNRDFEILGIRTVNKIKQAIESSVVSIDNKCVKQEYSQLDSQDCTPKQCQKLLNIVHFLPACDYKYHLSPSAVIKNRKLHKRS